MIAKPLHGSDNAAMMRFLAVLALVLIALQWKQQNRLLAKEPGEQP